MTQKGPFSTPEEHQSSAVLTKYPNAGLPWTSARKEELEKLFDRGDSLQSISEALSRTPGAIVSQLVRQHRLVAVEHSYHYVHSVSWCTFAEANKK